MAYQDELELQNQAKASPGGILAGSGGAASAQAAQPVGSGFTNLQTYLSANKGQGGQIADSIISEGQKGVDKARTAADETANAWADGVTQKANDGAADINSPYGGPTDASKETGLNDLETNYQNVKKGADAYAGDYQSQKAGLMKANNYGVGFGALDTFLGRQDGSQKIADWQKNVDTGSTAGAVKKANEGIQGAQTDLKFRQNQAIENAVKGSSTNTQPDLTLPPTFTPQATPAPISTTGVSSPWDGLKDLLAEINGTPVPVQAPAKPPMVQASGGSSGGGYNTRQRRR